ncbi:MAG: hypothetical protein K1000chlam3_01228 [Chlamydiae bacterium]|nr:hypothetical protein [Chlamydiota bacterium]
MKIKLFILFALLLSSQAFAKVRFLTFHCNKPDFIELQCKTLAKYMENDYELIVFNDANDLKLEEEIRETCEKYGIQCVRFEQEWHETDPLNDEFIQLLNDPDLVHSHIHCKGCTDVKQFAKHGSFRHAHVIQYAMDNFGYDHDDIVVILDGDLFPIRPLDLRALLKDYDIIGLQRIISEEKIDYLWVPFIAFNVQNLPNKYDLRFHPDKINQFFHDTGAHTYHYLKNNPQVRVKKYPGHSSTSFHKLNSGDMKRHGFNKREIELTKTLPWPQCVEFHVDHLLLHFGASSFNLEGHEIKEKCVHEFIEKILAD